MTTLYVEVTIADGAAGGNTIGRFFRLPRYRAGRSTGEDSLNETTGRIVAVLFDELRPIENWGPYPMIPSGRRRLSKTIF